jgi:hypothetical protein
VRLPKLLVEDFGRLVLSPRLHNVGLSWLGRPFSKSDRLRVCVYFDLNQITFAQVFPFIYYAPEFRALHNCEFRFFSIQGLLQGQQPKIPSADRILIMPWFQADRGQLTRALAVLRKASPAAVISFIDSFAHNDLRMASDLGDNITHYIKKSLFRDRSLFLQSHKGDTNLTEFYGALYDIDQPRPDWTVPEDFLDKLRLGPGFFTDPKFLRPFGGALQDTFQDRPIDLHMRLGTKGSGWYSAMRSEAVRAGHAVQGIVRSSTDAISYRKYVQELKSSKTCFSPFGYGEICWRDVEAFAYGAVLIKPDMSHLETSPNIYEAGVTYLPVNWDFSNLQEVVHMALGSPDLCRSIAQEAHRRISDHLGTAQFVRDMSFLFE